MKKRKPLRKPVVLEDLKPSIEKMHFHTDEELMMLAKEYASKMLLIACGSVDQPQAARDMLRYAERLIRLLKEHT